MIHRGVQLLVRAGVGIVGAFDSARRSVEVDPQADVAIDRVGG